VSFFPNPKEDAPVTTRSLLTTISGVLLALALTAEAKAEPWTFYGMADSQGPGGAADDAYRLKAYIVAPGTTLKAEFTNNNTVIVNKDGSHFGFQVVNPTDRNITADITKVVSGGNAVRSFNGKQITDVQYGESGFLGRSWTVKVAWFDKKNGGMEDLIDALASAGIKGEDQLPVPTFTSDLGQPNPPSLFVGAALQDLASMGVGVDGGALGSHYQVTNGHVSKLLSGTGPDPGALGAFFFSNTDLTMGPTAFDGSPFTGEVDLTNIVYPSVGPAVPEPSSALLFILGTASAVLVGRRKLTFE
jgi:hypothetical protein